MSEDYLAQQQPTLIWNSARGVWEKAGTANLLCAHSELFSGTWPISGMMLAGKVYELQMQERHTTGSEFSSLPTPTVSDQYTANLSSTQQSEGSLHSVTLAQIVNRPDLLPTPSVAHLRNWGKFEPAIRRWEAILDRPAPAPTKPDGKDGAHRLSSEFTEWMMGVPKGWITNCGLSRNDELKACGNGVVPQQAELALRILLGETA